jgi:hypothetical protein
MSFSALILGILASYFIYQCGVVYSRLRNNEFFLAERKYRLEKKFQTEGQRVVPTRFTSTEEYKKRLASLAEKVVSEAFRSSSKLFAARRGRPLRTVQEGNVGITRIDIHPRRCNSGHRAVGTSICRIWNRSTLDDQGRSSEAIHGNIWIFVQTVVWKQKRTSCCLERCEFSLWFALLARWCGIEASGMVHSQ